MFNGINFEKFVIFNFEKGFSFSAIFSRRVKLDKTNAQILFIDDEVFPIVEYLKKAGWTVKRIKELTNPQSEDVKRANIIFVDYKGVGKTLAEHDEGLGIVRILKNTYKDSKRVILCSGYGFTLDQKIDVADNRIAKGADNYLFIEMIENELKKLI